MGLFSFLSAKKTADNLADSVPKIIDGAISGIDALAFTKEESMEFFKGLLKQLYDQFMPRAISRRVIAIIIVSVFSIFCLTALGFACFNATNIVNNISQVFTKFKIGYITLVVIGFYFGVWPFVKKDLK